MRNAAKVIQQGLLECAIELSKSGVSVIPVYGDSAPSEPKRPTLPWRSYQGRIMSEAELRSAFARKASALGIVCGRVSGLVVVDFDDHLRYRRFCRHRPGLAKSYTVKTRRGYHVYFGTREKVPSHQFDGGDIKGERSYVVAPPSVIGGFEYLPIVRAAKVELDKAGVSELLNYFHVDARGKSTVSGVAVAAPAVDLKVMYRRLARKVGRNNALYRTALAARERGLSQENAERTLTVLHVSERGHARHQFESLSARAMEAGRTVASAFRAGWSMSKLGAGVPNSVREKLLREQESTVMARLLDILRLEGWPVESFFTLKQACDLCGKYGLNRKGVLQALTGELSIFNGRHIIARRYVEYMDIGGLKSGQRGRPVELMFQAPSAGRLLWVLNVEVSPSDRVTGEDVRRAHLYRRALHREYIRRLSPQLPMRVMAKRLGVDARTLRRYNCQLGVRSTVCVRRFGLSWDSLVCLPRRRRGDGRAATSGYWLESAGGYRAPAWRHIGAALLRRGESGVQVCMRGLSTWSLSREAPPAFRYEAISPADFVQLRLLRDGGGSGASVGQSLKRLVARAKSVASKARYKRVRLDYESVSDRIAEDKVAETIGGYLVAVDEVGGEVRRPARRGVAYRMLKQFGNGNVFLALRDSYRELLVALAGHAAGESGSSAGLSLLAPVLS